MVIRRAGPNDVPGVARLLSQVLEIHAALRPDLFVSGTRKYTDDELRAIFSDDGTPVFVAVDANDRVLGYCFCILREIPGGNCTRAHRTLYIDDLCVDEAQRGRHIGSALLDYVTAVASSLQCDTLTLQVWAGNDDAAAFYDAKGFTTRKTLMERPLQ